jgi:hypothetical protein
VERYSHADLLPRHIQLIKDVAAGKLPPLQNEKENAPKQKASKGFGVSKGKGAK